MIRTHIPELFRDIPTMVGLLRAGGWHVHDQRWRDHVLVFRPDEEAASLKVAWNGDTDVLRPDGWRAIAEVGSAVAP